MERRRGADLRLRRRRGDGAKGPRTPRRFPDDSPAREQLPRFRRTGEGQVFGKVLELTAVHKDGREFPVELSMSRVKLGGEWCAWRCGDITDRRIAEERLQQALADAGRLTLEAQAANLAKSQFLANMSHEIRTPMTAVLGYADLLAGALSDPEQVEAANIIRRNGNHLLAVINDILDLSKIEAGEIRVEQCPSLCRRWWADVVALMRVPAEAKSLTAPEFAGPIPETIAADPTRLRQILVNLVGNAVKFTDAGEVRIVAASSTRSRRHAKFQFDVIDTGIGIAADQIGRIFSPFIRPTPPPRA